MKIKFNLLPKKQKIHLERQKTFRIIMEQEIHIMIMCLFLIAGLFAIYFILDTETSVMSDVKKNIVENERYEKIAGMHNEFIEMNKKADLINKLNNNHLKWSRMFIFISDNVPKSIIVESVKTTNNVVSFQARAKTRGDVLELKDRFKNVKYNEKECFNDIIVPESQLAKPVDIDFTMSFKINLDCLK